MWQLIIACVSSAIISALAIVSIVFAVQTFANARHLASPIHIQEVR